MLYYSLKLLNVFLLQSFIAVVEPETAQGSREGEGGAKRLKQEVDPVLQYPHTHTLIHKEQLSLSKHIDFVESQQQY